MNNKYLGLDLVTIFEYIFAGGTTLYFIFSVLVLKQVALLTSSVRTNLSKPILGLALLHFLVSLLGVIAAASVIF